VLDNGRRFRARPRGASAGYRDTETPRRNERRGSVHICPSGATSHVGADRKLTTREAAHKPRPHAPSPPRLLAPADPLIKAVDPSVQVARLLGLRASSRVGGRDRPIAIMATPVWAAAHPLSLLTEFRSLLDPSPRALATSPVLVRSIGRSARGHRRAARSISTTIPVTARMNAHQDAISQRREISG